MRLIFRFLLVFCLYTSAHAQLQGYQLIDSLKTALQKSADDTGKVRILGKLSFQYFRYNTDIGIYFGEQALKLAEKLQWKTGKAFAYNYLGTNYAVRGNHPKAFEYFHLSLDTYKQIGDKQGIAFISNNLGNFYRIQGQKQKALLFLKEAERMNTEAGNEIELSKNLNNMGFCYSDLEEFQLSNDCYNRALQIQVKLNNQENIAQIKTNIAENKFRLKEYCSALKDALEALNIGENLGINYDEAVYASMVGEIYTALAFETYNDKNSCSNGKMADLQAAKKYLLLALEKFEEVKDYQGLFETSLSLSKVYEALGETNHALEFYKKYTIYKDSVFSQDSRFSIAEIENKQALTLKDKQIQIHDLEIERKNTLIFTFVLLFLVVALILIVYYQHKIKKKELLASIQKSLDDRALAESEERFRILYDNAPVGLFRVSLSGDFLMANSLLYRLFGFSRITELSTKNISSIITPPVNETNLSLMQSIINSGELKDFESTWKRDDGQILTFNLNAKLFKDSNGSPIYVDGTIEDITAKKVSEKALSELNFRYETLFTKASLGIVTTAVTGKIIAVNEYFASLHGYAVERLQAMSLKQLLVNNSTVLTENDVEALERGETLKYIAVHQKRDGGLLHFEVSSSQISVDNRIYILSFYNDVSSIIHANEELRTLSKAVEQNPVSIIITNPDGVLEYVNQKTLDCTGYDSAYLLSSNYHIFQTFHISEEMEHEIWTEINLGREWKGELQTKHADGGLQWDSVAISSIVDDSEKTIHFLVLKEDISEKKRTVAELTKAKDLAELSNKLKDAFIANISHEIRTPLNGILGMTSIIRESYEQDAGEEEKMYFLSIERSSKRLISTVDKILNFSRLQVGDVTVNLKRHSVSAIIKRLFSEYESLAMEKSVRLCFHKQADSDIINCDEASVHAIFGNLIDNAVKFTDSGSVDITLYRNQDGLLCVGVKDTGTGISEDFLPKLYDPYVQEQIGYGRAYEGLGLGLAIVNKLLPYCQASITVESKKNEGSQFTVCFNASADETRRTSVTMEIPATDPPPVQAKTGKPYILVVEDDYVNQLFIKSTLKKFYQLEFASNADAALALIKQHTFDVILMDISLRNSINGLELTKMIRNEIGNKTIPIIAVTGHALPEDIRNTIEAGCNDCLTKPFEGYELIEKIKQFIITN